MIKNNFIKKNPEIIKFKKNFKEMIKNNFCSLINNKEKSINY